MGPITGDAATGSALLLVAAALFVLYAACLLLRPHSRRRAALPATALARWPGEAHTASLRDIRYLERLVSDERSAEPMPFRVSDVVVRTVAARRAAGLRVDVFSRDGEAEGVAEDLATVLDNLLLNAERHGQGRGVQVESARAGDFVEIVVRDLGPGVPEPVRSQLFQPGSPSGGAPGTGLGLHISRNLLREHGGDLLLRETSLGAAFVARIPAQRRA